VEFFHELSYEEIEWILNRGDMNIIQNGTVLIKEETSGKDFYIILDGEMNVFQVEKGVRRDIRTMASGSIIGEIGALLHLNRTASVETISECVVLRYTDKLFNEVERINPSLANKLYRNVISILIKRYAIIKKDGV